MEQEASGTYTATGPDYPMTMRQMLEGVKEGVGSDATLAWFKSLPEDQQTVRTGIDPEKEASILAAWHERNA